MTLSSLDTNILVYAADADALEHGLARTLLESALTNPEEWILADQVLFEFYKALRNPRIFRKPLNAAAAAERVRFLRVEAGFLHCCYELKHWDELLPRLGKTGFPYQQTHDLLLGVTLKSNGVTRFYTRNTKDFSEMNFEELINPIDGQ